MSSTPPSYKGHRHPVDVISHCVWLYFRFPLSFREVEELMLQRGVIVPSVEHRSPKGPNNRAENSHQPTRQRERAMKGFRTVDRTQKSLSAFSQISPYFRSRRHRMTTTEYRAEMTVRFAVWDQVTDVAGLPAAA